MRTPLRLYGSPKILTIDRLNRLQVLRTWANDRAGLALAKGDTKNFIHHYRRVNAFQLAIIKVEKSLRS